jgi:hypothetical protein
VPQDLVPVAMVAIGYPAEQPTLENRYDGSRVHRNGW